MNNNFNHCEPFEILISAMIDDEISTSESHELELHLTNCKSCQSRVAAFHHVNNSLNLLSIGHDENSHWRRDAAIDKPTLANSLSSSAIKSPFSIWRLIPLAAAATLLVCLAIAAWPNPKPANANQISPEEFVEPMKEIHLLNLQKQRDQELMLRTLGMDLRSLKLELNELEPGSAERVKFAEQIDAMIEKVRTFE